MVNARPGARTRLRSTGRPLPAYSRRLVSLQAARSLCHAYGMHASRWQQQACVWNAASGGRCALPWYSLRSERGCSPGWLPLAACSNAPDISCICADLRASGRPWATAGATVESHVARLCKFDVQCAQQDWAWACPATRAASFSAADSGRTACAGSGCIGSIMRAPSHAIDHHRSKPSLDRSFIGPPSADVSTQCWRLQRRIRGAPHLLA